MLIFSRIKMVPFFSFLFIGCGEGILFLYLISSTMNWPWKHSQITNSLTTTLQCFEQSRYNVCLKHCIVCVSILSRTYLRYFLIRKSECRKCRSYDKRCSGKMFQNDIDEFAHNLTDIGLMTQNWWYVICRQTLPQTVISWRCSDVSVWRCWVLWLSEFNYRK